MDFYSLMELIDHLPGKYHVTLYFLFYYYLAHEIGNGTHISLGKWYKYIQGFPTYNYVNPFSTKYHARKP